MICFIVWALLHIHRGVLISCPIYGGTRRMCFVRMGFRIDHVLSDMSKKGGFWVMHWIWLFFFVTCSCCKASNKLNFCSLPAITVLIGDFLDRNCSSKVILCSLLRTLLRRMCGGSM